MMCLKQFARNEGGAVTVDMVPLIFMGVALSLVVSGRIISGVADLSQDSADHLDGNSIIVVSFNDTPDDEPGGGIDGINDITFKHGVIAAKNIWNRKALRNSFGTALIAACNGCNNAVVSIQNGRNQLFTANFCC